MNLPKQITELNQWITWDYVNGSKIPKQLSGANARTNDPSTFVSYDAVSHVDKIAFVIQKDDCLTGVDLDNCLYEQDGELVLRDWAKPIVEALCPVAYGEISPSGNGIKFLTYAVKPEGARCTKSFGDDKQQLEVYDKVRFWTITGDHWLGSSLEILSGQQEIEDLCEAHLMPAPVVASQPVAPRTRNMFAESQLERRARDYVDKAERPLSMRNNAAFRLAGHLRAMVGDFGEKLSDSLVAELVTGWNASSANPMDDREISKVIESSKTNGTAREAKQCEQPAAVTEPEDEFSDLNSGRDSVVMTVSQDTKSAAMAAIEDDFQDGHYSDPDDMPDDGELVPPPLTVPGLIEEVMKYTMQTSLYPQPELAFAGSLALMSVLTGRKVCDQRNTRTNLMIIGTGHSGSGKDHSRAINKILLDAAGAPDMAGPERLSSAQGIPGTLKSQPACLFQMDEFGKALASYTTTRSDYLKAIIEMLMTVESSSGSRWKPTGYAMSENNIEIESPHAVVFGSTVPGSLWGSLTKDSVVDGFLNRFLIFESPGYVLPNGDVEFSDPPHSLVEAIKAWVEHKQDGGETDNLGATCPNPDKAIWSPEAHERFKTHEYEIAVKRTEEQEKFPGKAALWSRTAAKTRKLSLIFAASRLSVPGAPVVELCDVERAIRIANWNTRLILRRAFKEIVENEQERVSKRVVEILRAPMTLQQIGRKTQWLKARERNDLLQDLVRNDIVLSWTEDTKGRPKTYFQAVSALNKI